MAVDAGDAALVAIPAQVFRMGADDRWVYPQDGEGPVREVAVGAFAIEPVCVTNARFGAFVAATGYVTDAQRYGSSFVFAGLLPDDFPPTRAIVGAEWWRDVPGATWDHPYGPQSDLAGLGDHPVVHVSRRDATAFCDWAGRRLATEPEWELAARGGLEGQPFPWGGELEPGGQHRMNVWQGTFPQHDSGADGYVGTAPVDAFAPNGLGLHNMTGNVWEWTAGPFGPSHPGHGVVRGGSFLCHASYCRRYRTSARQPCTPDSSLSHTGFRCAADL